MTGEDSRVLVDEAIVLGASPLTRDDAVTAAGELLVATGAVEPSYVESMHEREGSVSTHMGNGLAIPHGTNAAKGAVRRSAISFTRYREPVDWGGNPVDFVVGIAGADDAHLQLISGLAGVFTDEEQVQRLREASTSAEVRAILDGG
jgi:mannitol/fructose-specific phosphotransferase system IIA component